MKGNLYGYVRALTDKEIDRQMIAVWDFGVAYENVYAEGNAGREERWSAYQDVLDVLKEDDTLVVTSLDVLGNDCYELMDRWRYITITKKAGIIVLDLPLTNTGIEEDVLGKVVARITLGVMQHFDRSRQYKKQRQAEGIARARQNGTPLGRRPKEIPKEFEHLRMQWDRGEISARGAASALGVDSGTFRKWVRSEVQNQKYDMV